MNNTYPFVYSRPSVLTDDAFTSEAIRLVERYLCHAAAAAAEGTARASFPEWIAKLDYAASDAVSREALSAAPCPKLSQANVCLAWAAFFFLLRLGPMAWTVSRCVRWGISSHLSHPVWSERASP